MTEAGGAADKARQELYEIMQQETPVGTKIQRALELGKSYLGVENAHLTRIRPNVDHWEAIASTDPPEGTYPPGLVLDYQTSYCQHVLERDDSVALHDAPAQGWGDDPAFDRHGLHCYHGTPIHVDDEVYGTVCFVSQEPRDAPFDADETLFAELIARLIEHELERQQFEAETTRRANSINVLSRVLRHNLRNEMCVIRGRISVLTDQLDDNDYISDTLFDSIDDIIELSDKARKLETVVSTDYDREFVAIEPLVDRVRTAVALDYPDATIVTEVPEDLSMELMPSFELAITELAENAAEHAGPGAAIGISIERSGDGIELQVSDDGPGIPPQERTVLAEGVETPLVHGSGLGLWMVYWIVSSHDGTIEATSTDEGTTITVEIPQVTTADEHPTGAGIQTLQRGLDRFEAVFKESFDAMIIVTDERHIIDANDHAATLFDRPRDELLGRSLDEFTADGFDLEDAWMTLQTEGRYEGRVTIEPGADAERIVQYSAAADIILGQHLIVGRDITERIERERELAEVNRRLDAIFNNTHTFMGLLEPDGTVIEVNDTALSFGGLDRSSVVGVPIWETGWFSGIELTRETVRRGVARAQRGEFVREEIRVQGAGSEAVVDFTIRPLTDDDGAVRMLVPEGREITDRVEAEAELQAEQQFAQSLLESLPDPVYAFDTDAYLNRWNSQLETVTGYESSELEGCHVTTLVPDEEEDKIMQNFQTIIEERRAVTVTSAFETSHGERVSYEFTGGPIEHDDGSLRGVTGVGRAITSD